MPENYNVNANYINQVISQARKLKTITTVLNLANLKSTVINTLVGVTIFFLLNSINVLLEKALLNRERKKTTANQENVKT